ncbi:carboxymuconolactone decarboxylase family protein [Nocardia cyriacigeorgica]|nr:carboxymuconolactone decarboxylase family protein [Nocardia cyriacigeorgica]MBF6440271.1 carboxymuconolactone decarboxylase family protein [Nocardia cyriacigeorgica]MBF6457077.1 carboxymuconolactone decarboxylase family protein [Nocardia cyriacigeorgica]MBF6480993.1 carboxymuconolactone decarboxylase family protein [Nocardia cyriacigeorgica]MBF6554262.1 carboxymuconolactone decarboxylase family protein [Nocardia cyriacigeorgica]NEW26941.1 carboxymuconolactone decarboxylase family protein [N
MSRLPLVTPETADADQAELLADVQRQLGRVPNLYATLANSPATLRGYLALRSALTGGTLDVRTRERLALLVAADNGCDYCVAAHTMRAGRMGLSEQEIADTRLARAEDPHTDAVLRFAHVVLRERGRVDDVLLAEVRAQGVTDAELSEIVGHVALNILSNYFNHVARPELDFPPVAPTEGTTMTQKWRTATRIELVAGYTLFDRHGTPVAVVDDVRIAIEGGFLHVQVADGAAVQVVSAPAVARVDYLPSAA